VFASYFNSLFDPSMENSHYSIILYFLIGLALKKPIILKEGINMKAFITGITGQDGYYLSQHLLDCGL
jgi:hypothetical protein